MIKSIILSLSALFGVTRAISTEAYARYGSLTGGYYYIYSNVSSSNGSVTKTLNRNVQGLSTFTYQVTYDYSNGGTPTYAYNTTGYDNVYFSFVNGSFSSSSTPVVVRDTTTHKMYFSFTGYANSDTFLDNLYVKDAFGIIGTNVPETFTIYSTFDSLLVFVSYSLIGFNENVGNNSFTDFYTINLNDGEYYTTLNYQNQYFDDFSFGDFSGASLTITLVNNNKIADANYTEGYNTGYDSGYYTGFENGKTEGYDNGYQSGYNVGYNNGASSSTTFTSLLFTIADVPVYYLKSLFNFQLFGMPVYTAILSLITLIVVTFVVKKFI